MKFMFANKNEVFAIGEFDSIAKALMRVSKLADEIKMDVEVYELVYELKRLDAQYAWGQALMRSGLSGLDKAAAATDDLQWRVDNDQSEKN